LGYRGTINPSSAMMNKQNGWTTPHSPQIQVQDVDLDSYPSGSASVVDDNYVCHYQMASDRAYALSFEETIHVDVNITIIHTNVSEASKRNWSFCARNLSRDRISSRIFLVLIQYIKKQEGSYPFLVLILIFYFF
jgi:hypothetical protein